MNILRLFYQLSWKKIIGAGAFFLLIALIPVTLNLATTRTRTRSEAALIHPSPEAVTTKFEIPQGPPKIFLVDHFFGKVDDAVIIHGENLGGLHAQSSVYLSGQQIPQENLVTWTGSYIEFKVPQGAKSGTIEVNILGQKTNWPGMFFVVDENTETEINFQKNSGNPNLGILTAANLPPARELLVWLLIINNNDGLKLTPSGNVDMAQTNFNLPLGKVYEVKINLTNIDVLANQVVELINVTKNDQQVVGIARAEISRSDGTLIPVKSNPLYVSF